MRIVGAVVAALLAGACGGGGAPTGTASPTSIGRGEPLADAVRIDAAVDVSLAGADFTGVDDAAPVAVGDVVRTDDAGFAEINFYDGSVTRLDIDTSLQIVALSDAPDAAQIVTRMDLGRTWHRVADDIPDRTYTVETNVATATVRGTAFIVDCPNADTCTFTVLDGTIEITPTGGAAILLQAPDALRVTAAADDPAPAPVTGPDEDEWLARNADLDVGAGFDPLSGSPGPVSSPADATGSSLASFSGRWTATTSDFRIGGSVGSWAGSTIDLAEHPEYVFIRTAGGAGIGFGLLAGAVQLDCSYSSCSIADVDEDFRTASIRRDLDGRLVLGEGGPTCDLDVPGVGEVDEATDSTLVWTDLVVASDTSGFGDCGGDYAVATFEVTLTRAD